MKNLILALGFFLLSCAISPASLIAAERDQSGNALGRALKSKTAESGAPGVLRAGNPGKNNPCAEFGAGFVRAEGSSTCVKVGGYVRAGVGIQR